jgi:hypothetical protein
MVVISDFLMESGCDAGLSYVGAATWDGSFDAHAIQVIAPGEADPAVERDRGLVGDLRMTDVESGRGAEVTVTPETIQAYRREFDRAVARVRASCAARGVAYARIETETPIETVLTGALRRGGLLR